MVHPIRFASKGAARMWATRSARLQSESLSESRPRRENSSIILALWPYGHGNPTSGDLDDIASIRTDEVAVIARVDQIDRVGEPLTLFKAEAGLR